MRKLCCFAIIVSMMCSFITIPKASAASSYNYGEALQKAIMFYEFQRSGELPEVIRNNWRGDSALSDGADVGLDLTGGWYDAGDHVKFNLPMAYSQSMLAWSVYEAKDALADSGQLEYVLDEIKWVSDYLIRCHPSPNVFYYQVGNANADHSWWGPAEVMQMDRPSYKVDLSNPGSTVVGGVAAALASAAVIFKESNPSYAATCLQHAKELYQFAESTKSDAGYTAANGFYSSHSGFYDELSWAATWIYLASGDATYLEKAENYASNWGMEPQSSTIAFKWAHSWDDVHYGTSLLLARITGKKVYQDAIEMHLDYWSQGYNGQRITYTPKGLAWLDSWGSLRYATTTAFLASVYADWSGCSQERATIYNQFAKQQVDYALGSTGRSFVVGFGENAPKRPHHRTAQGSWADSMNTPNYHRHSLIGALVGGPGSNDSYTDDVSNYVNNEVACDYNAGFVGALAKLYDDYGGNPIPNLNAYEEITNDEFFVEAGINASGNNFIEIKALLYNQTGWPARVGDQLSFRYFIDITELIQAGYDASDVSITTNYNAGAKVTGLYPWDADNHIYYVDVDFTGTKIYPGGQSAYKKEVQFRIAAPMNTNFWDNSNDYSYQDIKGFSSGSVIKTTAIPVYDKDVLVYGMEPGERQDPEDPEDPEDPVKNSEISLNTGVFDRNPVNQADIPVTVTLNGNTLLGIKNGTSILLEGSDYSLSGDTVTIFKEYFANLTSNRVSLTFDFDAGVDPNLMVTIIDSSVVQDTSLKLEMFNGNTSSTVNGIMPRFKITNNGSQAIDLSTVTIRYYYTIDGEKNQNFWCDWSSIGNQNVIGSFVKMTEAKLGADYYLEIGFSNGAGVLTAGQSMEVQGRFSKADWTNYNQSDDYSFVLNNSYSLNQKVTLYILGNLQNGIEP